MLAAFESFGIDAALKRFVGMFALGIWDRKRRVLHLARDRMGKKPLYIAVGKGYLLFASELKAFRSFPGFSPTIDQEAVKSFLSQGWISEYQCIWEGVFKLPPASLVTLQMSDLTVDAEALRSRANTYWSLADVAEAGKAHPVMLSEQDLESELECLLKTVVRERMIADVPIGAFLSGGIDSSVVVALMQAQSSRPIKTFTIGFAEAGFDETRYAGKVARHLGTDQTEFRVTPKEALDVIPELPRVWDEPFADESQIPTLLLSRLARQYVTVVLSGDGGDECFGGYTRHVWSAQLTSILRAPIKLRRGMGAALQAVGSYFGKRAAATKVSLGSHPLFNVENAQRVGRILDVGDTRELYERLVGFGSKENGRHSKNSYPYALPQLGDIVSEFIYRDMTGYLPSDIFVKTDRATMASALEGRCPLVDHRLVEYSWRIPTTEKVHGRKGKWILRKVLRRHLPEALFERPKQGFNSPINSWLTGPLRDWAQDMLSPARLTRSGLQVPHDVDACWQEHLSGRRERSRELWAMLMLEAWFDEHCSSTTLPRPRDTSSTLRTSITAGGLSLDHERMRVQAAKL
jgi:asparagine synthase (glutamine-hydrolysing)